MRLGVLVGLTFLAGCQLGFYHTLDNPGQSQVVRVASGDRICFDLPVTEGCEWCATADDSDVDVSIASRKDHAAVELRIHRGYDGPSVVCFRQLRPKVRQPVAEFTLSLFKRTGDAAFWK